MQVIATVVTAPEKRGENTGKPFYTLRVAESYGKREDPNRVTVFYDVVANLDEVTADLLQKGQRVKISGRLQVEAYMKKDGTPGAAAKIFAFKVEHYEFKG